MADFQSGPLAAERQTDNVTTRRQASLRARRGAINQRRRQVPLHMSASSRTPEGALLGASRPSDDNGHKWALEQDGRAQHDTNASAARSQQTPIPIPPKPNRRWPPIERRSRVGAHFVRWAHRACSSGGSGHKVQTRALERAPAERVARSGWPANKRQCAAHGRGGRTKSSRRRSTHSGRPTKARPKRESGRLARWWCSTYMSVAAGRPLGRGPI
jgi:hypothetical protein